MKTKAKKKVTKKKVTKKKADGKKRKTTTGPSKRSHRKKSSAQINIKKFKAKFEKLFGQVNWKKMGKYALFAIIVLASKGIFGPVLMKLAAAVLPHVNTA